MLFIKIKTHRNISIRLYHHLHSLAANGFPTWSTFGQPIQKLKKPQHPIGIKATILYMVHLRGFEPPARGLGIETFGGL